MTDLVDESYKMGRREALEEAAKIADEMGRDTRSDGTAWALVSTAKRIRALIDKSEL